MKSNEGENIFLGKTIWILFALFVVSILVRIPNLDRPLSKHHEFCTALSLIILQSWTDGGIQAHQFNPSTTFSLPADHYINNCSMDTMQRNGNFYYLSHPPLAYYLPYATFRVLHIYPNVVALQIFNCVFEFITVLFIYFITALLFRCDTRKVICPTALLASAIYLFLPVTLWFHSNVYMADMFVQNMWAPSLFITLKIFLERKEKSPGWLLLFCFSLFLMAYTDWLGVFFAASVASAAAYKAILRRQKSFYLLAALSFVIGVATALLVLAQYSSIAGWAVLKFCLLNRYSERGSLEWNGVSNFLSNLQALSFNYAASYLPLLPAIAILIVKRKTVVSGFPNLKLFFILTFVPVIIDHSVFLKYTAQDFAVLKASFFLSIVSAHVIIRFTENQGQLKKSGLTAFIVVLGIATYFYINRPGNFSLSGDRYAFEQDTGSFIRQNAESDEVVFSENLDITPQIVFYAHRNIKSIPNESTAKKFLKEHSQNRGVIFKMKNGAMEIERIQQ